MAGELPPILFGTPGAMREHLVDLVVAGTKRATASLLVEWELDGEELSAPGGRWAILRTDGSRACVVEIAEVRVAPFGEVDERFHLDEGEGEQSRATWLRSHEAFWAEHVVPEVRRRLDPAFVLDASTPVVFERFRTVEEG